jgi:DNA-directed RNA polymerase sigma subunit (sigma70/sigma32)
MGELWQTCTAFEQASAEVEKTRYLRDSAIKRAKAAGLTLTEIAEIVGISKARVQQITPGDDQPADTLDDQRASA